MSRLFDVLLSGLLLVIVSPWLVYRGIRAYRQTGRVFGKKALLGYGRRPFNRLSFADEVGAGGLAVLFNVFAGDLAWAGVRALSVDEADQLGAKAAPHFSFRPGVVSAYGLKQQVGLAYDDEFDTDHAVFANLSPKRYCGLCVRGLLAWLLGGGGEYPTPPILHFWGVDIANVSMAEALDWLEQRIYDRQPALVAFVNPACLNIAYNHAEYRQVLQNATRVLPDGIGIKIACRLLGQQLRENVNGTDMFPRLCE
ncbi:MAG: glycosyltransferase, partial [Methylovulum sp.]|nr:glycosyltransferase [Methylovulum sp.]